MDAMNTKFEDRLLRALDALQREPRPLRIRARAKEEQKPAHEFDGMPKSTRRALTVAGIASWSDFAGRDAREIIDLPGVSMIGWRFIRSALRARGIEFQLSDPPKPTGPQPCVYFIKGGDCIKIGVADFLNKRLSGLRVGSPVELQVVGTIRVRFRDEAWSLESELHQRFSAHRVRGEWFRDCEEIRAYISAHAQEAVAS